MKLDRVDLAMIRALGDEGRMSVSDLAERLNISRTSAHTRLRKLQADDVVLGFSARIDPRKVGLEVSAVITVGLHQKRWRGVHDSLRKMKEVEYCAVTSGDFDLLLLVRAPDITTIRDVILERLHEMDEVKSTKTIFVLEEIVVRSLALGGE